MKKKVTVKKALIILVIIAVIGLAVIFSILNNKNNVEYITVKAERGRIVQTASETGAVKSANELSLSFLNSGKINQVAVKVGDKVSKGAILAEIDYTTFELSSKEAQANLDVAQGSLNKLKAGANAEDLAIAKAGVQQAKTAYESAQTELGKTKKITTETIAQAKKRLSDLQSNTSADITTYEQAIITAQTNLTNARFTYQNGLDNSRESALTTVDDKISKAIAALDAINRTLNDNDGKDLIGVSNKTYLDNTKLTYADAQILINTAQTSLNNAKSMQTKEYVLRALSDTISATNKTFDSLSNCFKSLENSIISSSFTQTELDALKANISAQQTSIGAAKTSLDVAKQAFNTALLAYDTNVTAAQTSLDQASTAYNNAILEAQNSYNSTLLSAEQQITAAETRVSSSLKAWQVAEAQLAKTNAPANSYDISLAEAKIRQAQAMLENSKKQIENSIIKAPIDGTITKINFEASEQVSPGQPAILMLGTNNFEIEVLISEADIANIKLNDRADVTLDAFGDDKKFPGSVYFIEPAETIIQDVVYYKVKVQFEPGSENVRSGMTANVIIVTAEKDDALIIPQRAIIDKNGQGKFVRVLEGNNMVEVKTEFGLSGDEGMVEVISGIKEGDTIITSIKEK